MKTTSRIRLRHIRCFLAVAEHGSVTRAAESLNTVQPALSRTLRELEAELDRPLFDRTAQGLVLTLAGEAFRRHVSTGVSQIERGIQLASGSDEVRSVSIGMQPNVTRTLVPAAVAHFKTFAPEVNVRLETANVSELVRRLRKGDVDFLLGRLLSLDLMTGIGFEHLYSEPLVFVVRKGHPLAGRRNLTVEDIDRYLVIVPLPTAIIRRELDKFTVARGLAEFTNKIETVSFEFARSYLVRSDAVACIPMGSVRQELSEGLLVSLDIQGEELLGAVGMSFMTGRELSPAAAQFAEAVREIVRTQAAS